MDRPMQFEPERKSQRARQENGGAVKYEAVGWPQKGRIVADVFCQCRSDREAGGGGPGTTAADPSFDHRLRPPKYRSQLREALWSGFIIEG